MNLLEYLAQHDGHLPVYITHGKGEPISSEHIKFQTSTGYYLMVELPGNISLPLSALEAFDSVSNVKGADFDYLTHYLKVGQQEDEDNSTHRKYEL